METTAFDDHGLRSTINLMTGDISKMLNHNFFFLGDIVGMKRNKACNLFTRFTFRYFWIICDTLFDFIECFIRYVIPQHIMDEALFNGLSHGIEVKRLKRAIWFSSAESLHSLWLRCRCERKEGNIRLVTTFCNGFKHPFF